MTSVVERQSFSSAVSLYRGLSYSRTEDIASIIFDVLPEGDYRRIMVKPNLVCHELSSLFPVEALVTHPSVIRAAVVACLERYPNVESIVIGDVPLQGCDWSRLMEQSGLAQVLSPLLESSNPRIRLYDLRREAFRETGGFLDRDLRHRSGDPAGYREVTLDQSSFLDPISDDIGSFRVSDYSPEKTKSNHRSGYHRYLIAGSALEADLLVNLPKMKTHQKAGITGALKNLVGINGDKARLVHYREGWPGRSDEFPPDISKWILLQARVRDALQGRSEIGFQAARRIWQLIKRFRGIETLGTPSALDRGSVYVAAGSWYGNDSLWRMIYDLNKIIRFAPAEGGKLNDKPQRESVSILDGIVAGEGNGPLQPLRVEAGCLITGRDPFAVDAVMARLMGFDWRRIPLLAQSIAFGDDEWAKYSLDEIIVGDADQEKVISSIEPLAIFRPAPGWIDHIELSGSDWALRC